MRPSPDERVSIRLGPVVVFEPGQRARMGLLESWRVMLGNLARSRELVWQLFRRDFVATYKQSVLGLLWIILSPVVGMLSWLVMNYAGVLNPGDVAVPYPVYILFGTTLWGLFISVYAAAAESLSSSGGLILQARFPHEVLVVQQMAKNLVALLVNMVMLGLVLAVFRIWPDWKGIFFPIAILPLWLLGSGLGMLVSVLAVVVHDVSKMVLTGLGLLMFITPVVYAPQVGNELMQTVIWWNPLTYLVGGARDLVLIGRIEHPGGFAWASVFALGVFLFSWRVFFICEQKVAEKS